MVAFIIWSITGCFFIGMGVFSFFARKPMGFWANIKVFEVEDVKGYNRACGKLWSLFGIIFIVLGLPLLSEQNALLILASTFGVIIEIIGTMIIYIMVIEKRYRKKQ